MLSAVTASSSPLHLPHTHQVENNEALTLACQLLGLDKVQGSREGGVAAVPGNNVWHIMWGDGPSLSGPASGRALILHTDHLPLSLPL